MRLTLAGVDHLETKPNEVTITELYAPALSCARMR